MALFCIGFGAGACGVFAQKAGLACHSNCRSAGAACALRRAIAASDTRYAPTLTAVTFNEME